MTLAPRQQVLQPQVWSKRQEIPQQRVMEPALMEGVKRTNMVVIINQGQGQRIRPPRRDSYAVEVDRGRNYYACGGFGHMARHYRNRRGENRIGDGRRLEYGQR